MVQILGIVNVTRDSFSDGGRYLASTEAIARGRQLLAEGADIVDIGAESTHPDAEEVPEAEELRRLEPVVRALVAEGALVSVDTRKPVVMGAAAGWGASYLNDVGGMRDGESMAAAAACCARVIVMFSRSPGGRARREETGSQGLLAEIGGFFQQRIAALSAIGVDRRRLILDPGMGLFLGAGPEPSLTVLRGLGELRRFDLPLLVSVSRKSFLGAVTGRATAERGAATLAAELWAALQGVDLLRTHEVAPLRDGLAVLRRLGALPLRTPDGPPR